MRKTRGSAQKGLKNTEMSKETCLCPLSFPLEIFRYHYQNHNTLVTQLVRVPPGAETEIRTKWCVWEIAWEHRNYSQWSIEMIRYKVS